MTVMIMMMVMMMTMVTMRMVVMNGDNGGDDDGFTPERDILSLGCNFLPSVDRHLVASVKLHR